MRTLVTGSSPGIGGAICLKLTKDAVARGETPHIAACELRETEALGDLVRDLRALGAEVITPTGDLGDPDVPARLIDETLEVFGGLDSIVGNAGIAGPAPLAELEIGRWDRLFNVNVRGNWLLAKAGYSALQASKGSFVAIASMSGMHAHRNMGAYGPSKAAVISLCATLAQEWAADGIRVNTVSPGMIRTPLTEAVYRDNATAQDRADLVPMGRVGIGIDIANVVAFLLGPDAGYMTGQNVLVDGGFVDSLYGHIPGLPRSGE